MSYQVLTFITTNQSENPLYFSHASFKYCAIFKFKVFSSTVPLCVPDWMPPSPGSMTMHKSFLGDVCLAFTESGKIHKEKIKPYKKTLEK